MDRLIVTQYWQGNTPLRCNQSAYPDRAICHAVARLQTDEYSATYAEVFHKGTGKLYGIFHRSPNRINILYQAKL